MVGAAGGRSTHSPSLLGNAGAAGSERSLSRKRRRHVGADVLPSLSVGGPKVREDSIHRVAVRDSPIRSPESKAIIEGIRELILELQSPSRSAIHGFIDSKIRWYLFQWTSDTRLLRSPLAHRGTAAARLRARRRLSTSARHRW